MDRKLVCDILMLRRESGLEPYVSCLFCYLQAAAEKRTTCDTFVEVNDLITCDMDAMKAYFKMAAGQ